MSTRNVAIMMTDIKGFTARTSEATREGVVNLITEHDRLLRPVFRHFRGTIVKTIGDAFLVWFESPTDAVLCGLTIQEVLRQHNARVPADQKLEVRVAVNSGEVEFRKGDGGEDIFGEPVNLTARLEGITEAGEVWFTEAVHLTMNRAEAPSSAVGERTFKGIPDPVKVYKVIDDPNSDQIRRIAALVKFEGNVPIIAGERPPKPGLVIPVRPVTTMAAGFLAVLALLLAIPFVLLPKVKDHRAIAHVRSLLRQEQWADAYDAADARLAENPGCRELRVLAARALVSRERTSGASEDHMYEAIRAYTKRFEDDPEVWWETGSDLEKGYIAGVALSYWHEALDLGTHRGDPRVLETVLRAFDKAEPGETWDGDALEMAQTYFAKPTLEWAHGAVTDSNPYHFLNAMYLLEKAAQPEAVDPLNLAVRQLLSNPVDLEGPRAAILAEKDPAKRAWVRELLEKTENGFYLRDREGARAIANALAPPPDN